MILYDTQSQVRSRSRLMPATKPPRTIRLVRSPHLDGVGVFVITAKNKSTYYTLHEIPCEIGGRGFAIHRTGLGDLYHVRVSDVAEDCTCECMGFLRHGYCRHVLGLMALLEGGLLDATVPTDEHA